MIGSTHMQREIVELPDAVARLIATPLPAIADAGALLQRTAPPAILTIGRGSSDHAATYLKYAIEIGAGRPVASIGPSVASVFDAPLSATGMCAIAVSQSGSSADIVALAERLGRSGAHVLALTNRTESPLAQVSSTAVDILAGPERAVAATKSFVNSIVTGLLILAAWPGDDALQGALPRLPARLARALRTDWGTLAECLQTAQSLMILARGPALGLASEAALKTMETCAIHASAYSAAEIMHGPSTLLTERFPVLVLGRQGVPGDRLRPTLDRLSHQGARLLHPPVVDAPDHPFTDPLLEIVGFYQMIEAEARRRGRNPDKPAFLKKETSTV